MGRSKGSNDKYWVAEDKYRIIKPTLGLDKSIYIITRETEQVVSGNLFHKVCKWLNIKIKAKYYGTYKKQEKSLFAIQILYIT